MMIKLFKVWNFLVKGPETNHLAEFFNTVLDQIFLVFVRVNDYTPEELTNFILELHVFAVLSKLT